MLCLVSGALLGRKQRDDLLVEAVKYGLLVAQCNADGLTVTPFFWNTSAFAVKSSSVDV